MEKLRKILREIAICYRIYEKLKLARNVKHPVFAIGIYHALGFLGEEFGEVSKEITKSNPGWEERMDAELEDLIVVASRMLFRDYED